MTRIARLAAVSLDCADPASLATFYAALTGGEIAFSSDDFVAVQGPAVWVTVQRVADHQPPTWPAAGIPKQTHLDFAVADLDAAQQAAEELGARVAEEQPAPDRWRVLLDPAGHPFCFTTLLPVD